MKKSLGKLLKITGIICTAILILSSLSVGEVSAAGKITYTFSGEEKSLPGYAQGRVELSGLADGEYYLYWADDSRALEGYYEIAAVSVKGGKGEFSFADHNAIPAGAKKLIATQSKNAVKTQDAAAVYDIPQSKRLKYEDSDANYTFMSYSDIHIDQAQSVYYIYSEEHWAKALETATKRNADFIITSGDNITNGEGPGEEYDKYQEILADSDYLNPVYESGGNHELRTGDRKSLLGAFINATGLDGNSDTIAANRPYYTVEEPNTGDLFIFMALEYKYDPQSGDEFSKKQLKWLRKILKENYGKNRNIYLIEHAPIESYGAGDDPDNYYTVPLKPDYDSTGEFQSIIEQYPDIIWISGHTHIAFKYGYNYSDMDGASCHMIHNSSVCCPTMLNYNSHNLSYAGHNEEKYRQQSEGYYVRVFDDSVVFCGENLYSDKIYPTACYIVESGRKSFEKADSDGESITGGTGVSFADSDDMVSYLTQVVTLPKSLRCTDITSEDLESLAEKSQTLLNDFYPFSSYDSYQRLKRAVRECEDISGNRNTLYRELSRAYLDFLPLTKSGDITLYFANTKNWDNVYAKLWSSKNDNGSKGEKMTYAGKDENKVKLYKIQLNYNQYKQVRFGDGSDKEVTEDQTLSGESNKLYTANKADYKAPYYCMVSDYEGEKTEE